MFPISTLLLLLALASPRADPPSPTRRDVQTDTAVARIRREYAQVNAILPRCTRQTLDVSGKSLEGGEMEVYRCGGEIRKINARYYGETGQARYEWYLAGERPFFVFQTETRYRGTFGPVSNASEERVYLHDRRMIRWIGGDGRARSTTSVEASRKLADLREEIDDLLDRARTGRTDAK